MKLKTIIKHSLFVGLTACSTISPEKTPMRLEDFPLNYSFSTSVNDTTFTIFYRDRNKNGRIDFKEIEEIKPLGLSKEKAYDLYLRNKRF